MRPLYDEFEDFDFGDTDVVSKMMREQLGDRQKQEATR